MNFYVTYIFYIDEKAYIRVLLLLSLLFFFIVTLEALYSTKYPARPAYAFHPSLVHFVRARPNARLLVYFNNNNYIISTAAPQSVSMTWIFIRN